MNNKPMSQEEFQAKRKEAMANEPVAKAVPLSKITLDTNSYRDKFIIVDGHGVAVSDDFFGKMSKMLHISDALRTDLTGGKKKGDSDKTDGELFTKMVDALKLLKTGKNGGSGLVTVVGNPISGELSNITDRPYNRIPNAEMFKIAENLVNRYPILTPIGVDVKGGGMDVGINLLSNADVPFKPSNGPGGGVVDETFNFGFTLNNGSHTALGDFSYRQICSNGMMGMSKVDQFLLRSLGLKDIQSMFEHIAEAEKRQFVPQMFERNMKLAMGTNASFKEIEDVYHAVTMNLKAEENADLRDHFKREIGQNFFQGYLRTIQRMAKKNIDHRELTMKQKQFISSGQNMWDVINNMTWLGSHNSGYDFKDQTKFRKLGGKLMGQEYDLAYADLMTL